jgi:hypothetical protein
MEEISQTETETTKAVVRTVSPGAFLNINNALEASRFYTNDQLMAMYYNLESVIMARAIRRNYSRNNGITSTIEKYLTRNLKTAGKYLHINDIKSYEFSPSCIYDNLKINSDKVPYNIIGFRLYIGVRYGEVLKSKMFVNDEEEKELSNEYDILITYRHSIDQYHPSKYVLKLIPPAHHIANPPFQSYQDMLNYQKTAIVKYNLATKIRKKSTLNTKQLQYIYGKMLQEIADFYVTQEYAIKAMELGIHLQKQYDKYHICAAKSATLTFILIARFRPHLLPLKLPYDVIKYIASYVWESRYDNAIWGITNTPINHKKDVPRDYQYLNGEDPPVENLEWDEDHYSQHNNFGPYNPIYRQRRVPSSLYQLNLY